MVILCVFEPFLAENLTSYYQVYTSYITQMTRTTNFVVVGTPCPKSSMRASVRSSTSEFYLFPLILLFVSWKIRMGSRVLKSDLQHIRFAFRFCLPDVPVAQGLPCVFIFNYFLGHPVLSIFVINYINHSNPMPAAHRLTVNN